MTINLKIKICKMYFLQDISKTDIGERLGISRFRVSRLIQEALQDGLVKIVINEPYPTFSNLEEQLEQRFNLHYAIVVEPPDDSNESIMRTIGRSAAEHLVTRLKDGDVLGVTWGATVNEVIDALPPKVDAHIDVVQIMGGLDQMAINVSAIDMVRRIADIYNANVHVLHAPAFVTSKPARDALLSISSIQKTFAMFKKVNIALSGIGVFSTWEASNLVRSGNLSDQDIDRLRSMQCVGDIFGHFFDINGQMCDAEYEDRIMGMSIDMLKKVQNSIGVAGGIRKSKAILGALRGKLINILVTDKVTACEILKEDGFQPSCEDRK